MPGVPMISRLVMSAPSQWVTSISSWPDKPGKRYLFPPENPTTSCGRTGPITTVTSLSVMSRLIRTSTTLEQAAPESWPTAAGSRVPTEANVSSRHHSWFTTGKLVGPTMALIASGDIGAWVPSATTTVHERTRSDTAGSTAARMLRSGQFRVASGTTRHRERPSRSTPSELLPYERPHPLLVEHARRRRRSSPSRLVLRAVPCPRGPAVRARPPPWRRSSRRTCRGGRSRARWSRSRPLAARSRVASGSSTSGSFDPSTSRPAAAATQIAVTVAKRVVSSPALRRAATTGRKRWGSLREPSAPTCAHVCPRYGLRKRPNASAANSAGRSEAGMGEMPRTSSTSRARTARRCRGRRPRRSVWHPARRPP